MCVRAAQATLLCRDLKRMDNERPSKRSTRLRSPTRQLPSTSQPPAHAYVSAKCTDVKSPDSRGHRGQKTTPVTDVRGIVEIIMLLPGHRATRVRREAAELLCRWLGGDLTIIEEACRNRMLQHELAVQNPAEPLRVFGEAGEAGAGAVAVSEQHQELARLCTDLVA